MKNEGLFYSFVTLIIFVLFVGFITGNLTAKKLNELNIKESAKNEKYFQTSSCRIYKLATEYFSYVSETRKKEIKKELRKEITLYNRETSLYTNWTYNCPKNFSLQYLGVEE